MRRVFLAFTCLVAALASGCGGSPGGGVASTAPGVGASDDSAAVDARDDADAIAGIRSSGAVIGLGRDDSVRQRDLLDDQLGERHVRFERFHAGLHVLGGDFVVHSRADADLGGFSATLRERLSLDTTPALTSVDAATIGVESFPGTMTALPRTELVIDAIEEPALAYDVVTEGEASDGTPTVSHALVDAQSGAVLHTFDDVHTFGGTPFGWTPPPPPPAPPPVTRTAAIGVGKSLFGGVVTINTAQLSTGGFDLTDCTGNNVGATVFDLMGMTGGSGMAFTSATDTWGSGATTDRASVAVDVTYGGRAAYDYYLKVHGRAGVANDGKGPVSRVHYGRNVANSFWMDGSPAGSITYGDGFVLPYASLDIAAHELTHGVTSHSAGLIYGGESGGLNEATSDIFGTCVEFFTHSSAEPGNYLIGEKCVPGGYLRSMSDPRADGKSVDNYAIYAALHYSMDVHYSSGIANNFFYLLSEGGKNRTSGLSVTGITRFKAEKIWYRALTAYMTSATNFAGARAATLHAASDLYGASGSEQAAVAAAWVAVGVR